MTGYTGDGIAGMLGTVQKMSDVYTNNPQPLKDKVEKASTLDPALLEALATQKITSEKEAAQRQMTLAMEEKPSVVKQNESKLLEQTKNEVAQQAKTAQGIRDTRQKKAQKAILNEQLNKQATGIASVGQQEQLQQRRNPLTPREVPKEPPMRQQQPRIQTAAQGGLMTFTGGGIVDSAKRMYAQYKQGKFTLGQLQAGLKSQGLLNYGSIVQELERQGETELANFIDSVRDVKLKTDTKPPYMGATKPTSRQLTGSTQISGLAKDLKQAVDADKELGKDIEREIGTSERSPITDEEVRIFKETGKFRGQGVPPRTLEGALTPAKLRNMSNEEARARLRSDYFASPFKPAQGIDARDQGLGQAAQNVRSQVTSQGDLFDIAQGPQIDPQAIKQPPPEGKQLPFPAGKLGTTDDFKFPSNEQISQMAPSSQGLFRAAQGIGKGAQLAGQGLGILGKGIARGSAGVQPPQQPVTQQQQQQQTVQKPSVAEMYGNTFDPGSLSGPPTTPPADIQQSKGNVPTAQGLMMQNVNQAPKGPQVQPKGPQVQPKGPQTGTPPTGIQTLSQQRPADVAVGNQAREAMTTELGKIKPSFDFDATAGKRAEFLGRDKAKATNQKQVAELNALRESRSDPEMLKREQFNAMLRNFGKGKGGGQTGAKAAAKVAAAQARADENRLLGRQQVERAGDAAYTAAGTTALGSADKAGDRVMNQFQISAQAMATATERDFKIAEAKIDREFQAQTREIQTALQIAKTAVEANKGKQAAIAALMAAANKSMSAINASYAMQLQAAAKKGNEKEILAQMNLAIGIQNAPIIAYLNQLDSSLDTSSLDPGGLNSPQVSNTQVDQTLRSLGIPGVGGTPILP